MARPSKNTVSSGNPNWDAAQDDNFEAIFNAPFPVHEHTGDESDLESTFPAAAHDRCMVWVDHTTLGWVLYMSDGTSWNIKHAEAPTAVADIGSPSGTAETKLNELMGVLRAFGFIS